MIIERFEERHYQETCALYRTAIRSAFEGEGLGHLEDEIESEIAYKIQLLDAYLKGEASARRIMVAVETQVVGTISFGPFGKEIRDCLGAEIEADGELGGLYVLPPCQNRGVGSALIEAILSKLKSEGIRRYALDSGYKKAQVRWLRKFGRPYRIVKDYWGPGFDHMIWICDLS